MSIRTSLSDDLGAMVALSCEHQVEFEALRSLPVFRHHRALVEKLVLESSEDQISIDGFCVPCGRPSSFQINRRPMFQAGNSAPNWREGLHCVSCGMNNRIRSMSWMTEQALQGRDHPRIYATEQRTPFYEWLVTRYGEGVIGSEYLDPVTEPGSIVEGIRHEDVERLSFDDESIDVVISMDVLEHVNDPVRAIGQIARVLRPGGVFLLSVPFFAGSPSNVRRSEIVDGSIVYHEAAEYHGAQPPDHGWLVFWDLGWQFVEDLRGVFDRVEVVVLASRQYAHLGPNLMAFRCGHGR